MVNLRSPIKPRFVDLFQAFFSGPGERSKMLEKKVCLYSTVSSCLHTAKLLLCLAVLRAGMDHCILQLTRTKFSAFTLRASAHPYPGTTFA